MVERGWRGGDVALVHVTRQPTGVGGSYFSAKGIQSFFFVLRVRASFNCRLDQASAAMSSVYRRGGVPFGAGPQCADLAL